VLSMAGADPTRFHAMEYADSMRKRFHNKRLITDDNMGTEWLPWWLRPVDLPDPQTTDH
jgi:hypothetical protein